ncbi:(2Fe-2S)-binding protein [Anaerostipes caccae]|uniref:(2Fe-2S)-binding protein n=1 Tax=Anaerostipes caccae TaxID=105841 RepID=UPI0038D41C2B
MEVKFQLNGKPAAADIEPDCMLLDLLRDMGCYSVKRGCDTTNCGLCTVLVDGKPSLSCAMPAARAEGKEIVTLEGLQEDAEDFGRFLAKEGAEQCGYCSPGFIMNVIAMMRELKDPSIEEIKEYLAGNLCRCSGYEGQMRAIQNYMKEKGGQ